QATVCDMCHVPYAVLKLYVKSSLEAMVAEQVTKGELRINNVICMCRHNGTYQCYCLKGYI
ncbi:MAG: hypothetical protein ACKPKO_16915, partial [Candidatus Fonsibacter sp.]